MHILLLTENFPPEVNAAATRIFERGVYWTRWGHEVTIITTAPNFPAGRVHDGYENSWHQQEHVGGMRVIRVKSFIHANEGFAGRIADFLSFMVTGPLAGLLVRAPDVIVANSPQFFCAVGGWLLSVARGRPFIFELADLWPASIAAVGAMRNRAALHVLELVELFLYRRARAVIALTSAFKLDLTRRGIASRKIAVVTNGVDMSRYSPRDRDAALAERCRAMGRFVVGYIGTHGLAHDLMKVIEAAEILRAEQRILFLFVGDGAERKRLVGEAAKRSLDNVEFVASRPKQEMPSYWSLCDVALIHLKADPVFESVIPSKMFEAMGMGIPPLLVSPRGEASGIVEQTGCGTWIEAGDARRLADVALALSRDPDRLQSQRAHCHIAARLYTRERQAKAMLRVVQATAASVECKRRCKIRPVLVLSEERLR